MLAQIIHDQILFLWWPGVGYTPGSGFITQHDLLSDVSVDLCEK